MPDRMNYPVTVAEALDDTIKFKPDVLRAVRAFAQSKPWQESAVERISKLNWLHADLCRAYDLRQKIRLAIGLGGVACYYPAMRLINLPRLSVVTYLHEFAHALGRDERQACRWSINLFRRCFPRSFARCRQVGHMLITPERRI